MTNEFPFLENIRTALGVPAGASRTKNMFPDLFSKQDKKSLIDKIRTRSYQSKETLIEQLDKNCRDLNIDLHVVDSHEDAENVTVELIRTKEPEFSYNRHIIQHTHPDIAAMKLWKRFNRESVTIHTTYPGDEEVSEKTVASYIGITAPDITVASSATLVQLTSSGCPRSTSLVPSIHIALVRSKNLVENLEEAYALLEQIDPQESFVFISGPSKTADIEAHLVHGAHGPKELHIILIKETKPIVEPPPEPDTNQEDQETTLESTIEEMEEMVAEKAEISAPASDEPTSENEQSKTSH